MAKKKTAAQIKAEKEAAEKARLKALKDAEGDEEDDEEDDTDEEDDEEDDEPIKPKKRAVMDPKDSSEPKKRYVKEDDLNKSISELSDKIDLLGKKGKKKKAKTVEKEPIKSKTFLDVLGEW